MPGRTELAGNHTDHQNGRVLAAPVDVGVTAEVTEHAEAIVRIVSDGFEPFSVALDDPAPRESELGTPQALVRGVAAAMREAGGEVCGFDARVTSLLRSGGGLSSSAAFEILMGAFSMRSATAEDSTRTRSRYSDSVRKTGILASRPG